MLANGQPANMVVVQRSNDFWSPAVLQPSLDGHHPTGGESEERKHTGAATPLRKQSCSLRATRPGGRRYFQTGHSPAGYGTAKAAVR